MFKGGLNYEESLGQFRGVCREIKKKVWLQWDANVGPSDWKAEAKAMSYQGLNECNGLDSRVYDMHIKCQV